MNRRTFFGLVALLVLDIALALPVAAWSWIWATYPVNDAHLPLSDEDWNRMAMWEAGKTVIRAAIVLGVLCWFNRTYLESSTGRVRRLSYVAAAIAAMVVVIIGWHGALQFVREHPVL